MQKEMIDEIKRRKEVAQKKRINRNSTLRLPFDFKLFVDIFLLDNL